MEDTSLEYFRVTYLSTWVEGVVFLRESLQEKDMEGDS